MAPTLEPGSTRIPGQAVSPNPAVVPASVADAATAAAPAPRDFPGEPDSPGTSADHELAACKRQAIGDISCVQSDWLAYLASLAR